MIIYGNVGKQVYDKRSILKSTFFCVNTIKFLEFQRICMAILCDNDTYCRNPVITNRAINPELQDRNSYIDDSTIFTVKRKIRTSFTF